MSAIIILGLGELDNNRCLQTSVNSQKKLVKTVSFITLVILKNDKIVQHNETVGKSDRGDKGLIKHNHVFATDNFSVKQSCKWTPYKCLDLRSESWEIERKFALHFLFIVLISLTTFFIDIFFVMCRHDMRDYKILGTGDDISLEI